MAWRDAYAAVAVVSAISVPMMFLLLRSQAEIRQPHTSGRLDPTVLKSGPVRYVILGYSIHALNLYAIRVWLPAEPRP